MTEIWKPVVGYEGIYEVSDFGRVKSMSRDVASGCGATRTLREIVLVPCADKDGYFHVGLWAEQKMVRRSVARLVAAAFHGAADGKQVNHIDGNRQNNSADNLEWVTLQENIQHSIHVLKSKKRGAATAAAKLTEEDVARIRDLLASGATPKEVAQQFNIHRNNVYSIRDGRTWKQVA